MAPSLPSQPFPIVSTFDELLALSAPTACRPYQRS
jgi:hypothetical protein